LSADRKDILVLDDNLKQFNKEADRILGSEVMQQLRTIADADESATNSEDVIEPMTHWIKKFTEEEDEFQKRVGVVLEEADRLGMKEKNALASDKKDMDDRKTEMASLLKKQMSDHLGRIGVGGRMVAEEGALVGGVPLAQASQIQVRDHVLLHRELDGIATADVEEAAKLQAQQIKASEDRLASESERTAQLVGLTNIGSKRVHDLATLLHETAEAQAAEAGRKTQFIGEHAGDLAQALMRGTDDTKLATPDISVLKAKAVGLEQRHVLLAKRHTAAVGSMRSILDHMAAATEHEGETPELKAA
jgi:hypothetical protein